MRVMSQPEAADAGHAPGLPQSADEEDRDRRCRAELAETQKLAEVASLEWDARDQVMRWSEQMFALLGLAPEECRPSFEHLLASMHPNERPSFLTWVSALRGSGETRELNTRLIRPDGTTRVVRVRAHRDLEHDGTLRRIVATLQDITERMHAEQRFQRLLEAAPDALLVVGGDGTIVIANSQAERLFGYDQAELLGRTIDLLVPARFGAHSHLRAGFFASPATRPMGTKRELWGLRKDGTEVPVEISLSPMGTAEGTLAICAVRDVTARHEIEAELRRARSEAEAANRAKSEFLATMSHEIRTPMNGVIGAIDLLGDDALTPHQRELVSMAESSAKALLTVINDILDFSKIEADKMVLECAPFDLRSTMEEVGDVCAARADQKGLEFILRYVPGTRHRFLGDGGRLRQVVTNLVGNAVKFCERGQVILTISEDAHPDVAATAMLRVTVEDSGIGIPAEAAGRLFERFAQADTSTTRRFGGTGLGLAICKRLVELMGGSIGVTSVVGEGSTFWFTVPLGLDSAVAPDAPLMPASLADARVLVVDDNAAGRRVLEELLASWHLRSHAVASAVEARAALEAASAVGDPFHMGLMDHSLPGIDLLGPSTASSVTTASRTLQRIALLSRGASRTAPGHPSPAGCGRWSGDPDRSTAALQRRSRRPRRV